MMNSIKALRIYTLCLILAICACASDPAMSRTQQNHLPGGPYYFGTWYGYKDVPWFAHELTPNEAKSSRNYYVAYFNDGGWCISFAKYTDGKLSYGSEYNYDSKQRPNSKCGLFRSKYPILKSRRMIKGNGEVTIVYYNKHGNAISHKTDRKDTE